MQSLAELLSSLSPDNWRKQTPFSQSIVEVNDRVLRGSIKREDIEEALGLWLEKHQPCLFGRLAAKLGLLSFCILTEADLQEGDESVRNRIQEARKKWTRDAFEGLKSGFIIALISPAIVLALPDQTMKAFARRLASLYLLEEVDSDRVYLDEVFLEASTQKRTTWRWHAGVNYFSAQGDGRWWQDHRIPGGMAFSVNSVGHMVKSGLLVKAMDEFGRIMGLGGSSVVPKVDSLPKALEFAMRTIAMSSEAVSGKATELLPLDVAEAEELPACPVVLPTFLKGKNYCTYSGRYHTDVTLPSEYFEADVKRPKDLHHHLLDFTYLFVNALDNPDFISMGSGRQIRALQDDDIEASDNTKLGKAWEIEIPVVQSERLIRALGQ
jgi:hypothetical protein